MHYITMSTYYTISTAMSRNTTLYISADSIQFDISRYANATIGNQSKVTMQIAANTAICCKICVGVQLDAACIKRAASVDWLAYCAFGAG